MSSIRDIWLYAHSMMRSARQIINTGLKPLNLSSAEGNILLHLLVKENELRQEQLVAQLDIGKAAISRAIDSLETKGYVVRKRHPGDKRACSISLTEMALKAGPDIEQIYNHIYTLARQGIPDEEFDRSVNLLSRIADNFIRHQIKEDE